MTGHTPLTPGATRRLASGTLRYFLDRDVDLDLGRDEGENEDGGEDGGEVLPNGSGQPKHSGQASPAQPAPVAKEAPGDRATPAIPVGPAGPSSSPRRRATDARGLLTLGWHGPCEPIIQPYSGPASPYWASKGFLGLLMPAGHPVWTAAEEALPAETADAVTVLGPPAMLIQSTAADGLVRLHNHGSNHVGEDDDPGYSRYAYSTRTGFTTTDQAGARPGRPLASPRDNHFALIIDGECTPRGPATPLASGPGWVASVTAPLPGVRIVSATMAHGRAEIRVHLVVGADAGTRVRQTGWACTPGRRTHGAPERRTGRASQPAVQPIAQLHPLHGYTGTARQLVAGPTMFGPGARVLALDGVTTAPESLFVSLASLTAEPDPAPAAALADIQVGGPRTIHVTWQDGTTAVLRLPELPEER
ncbi:DUF2264 domain-containing protein [Streptomyces sp. SID10853]|nr:DUF2264 domain-containing protein [Streptomyces sp. SID10853]